MQHIRAILFDKDGTLFDFRASWGHWTLRAFEVLAPGDAALQHRLAVAVGFDLQAVQFEPDSPFIAETADIVAMRLLAHLPGMTRQDIAQRLDTLSEQAQMVPAVPLVPLLDGLRARGLRLGVATNDAEAAARTQLHAAGVVSFFDPILGYDSGYGAKPAPGMLLAFADRIGLDPGQILMVGDSAHDLIAGRAAGMATLAVLTGIAEAPTLAPHADRVVPDIGHLPALLQG